MRQQGSYEEHIEAWKKFLTVENPNSVRLVDPPSTDPVRKFADAVSALNAHLYTICCAGCTPAVDMKLIEQAAPLLADMKALAERINQREFGSRGTLELPRLWLKSETGNARTPETSN
jgi:hypothetical protein